MISYVTYVYISNSISFAILGQNVKRLFDKTHEMSSAIFKQLKLGNTDKIAIEAPTDDVEIFNGIEEKVSLLHTIQKYLNTTFLFNIALILCVLYYGANLFILLKNKSFINIAHS